MGEDEVVSNGRGVKKRTIDKALLLQQVANRTAQENLNDVIACLLYNIQDMHLPSLKLLFEIIRFRFEESSSPEEGYDSLAKLLTGLYQKQLTGAVLDESEARLAQAGNLDLGVIQESILSLE